jgi:RimJ/RimL family protein N-acetyltransferase
MLQYRKIDVNLEKDLQSLVKWYSDPEIRHLCHRHSDEQAYQAKVDPAYLAEKIRRKLKGQYWLYMVTWGNEAIGEFSIECGGSQLLKHHPKSALVGLIIGEAKFRGAGLGGQIMGEVETLVKSLGVRRIELAAFKFNHPAIRLYQKLGYTEFQAEQNTTYWGGRMHSSIRLEKRLD